MKSKMLLLVFSLAALFIFYLAYISPLNNTSEGTLDAVYINEVVTENLSIIYDEDARYSDYIELYNSSSNPINLQGYGLSDDAAVPLKWTFPSVVIEPGKYLIVFASGKDFYRTYIHTNFCLDKNGDRIALSDPKGNILQQLPLAAMIGNMSYGKNSDGQFVYYTLGTPSAINTGTIITDLVSYKRSYDLEFSENAGFFETPIALSISVNNPDATIHYTLDGSEPTFNSPIYTEALGIDSRENDPNLYANIKASFTDNITVADEHVYKSTVVRARAFLDMIPVGHTKTATYFIDPLGGDRYSLPVVSLTTDPYHLFDEAMGIFVVGTKFEMLSPAFPDGGTPANYNQRGREWERPVYLEYFDTQGKLVFDQNLGVRTFGGWSRANDKKSLKLFARKEYDEANPDMDYPFIENLYSHSGEPIESFDRLILRGGGNDWESSMFRDVMMQSMVEDILDTQHYQPVIMFLNGEYWGIYYIRETEDKSYIENHYGIDGDDVTILAHLDNDTKAVTLFEGIEEDVAYYEEILDFAKNNDLSDPENFAYMETKFDIDNMIKYYVSQMYFGNTDWPGNNVKLWRKRTDTYEKNAPFGQDGRYRFMIYDLDFGFDLYPWFSGLSGNPYAFVFEGTGKEWPNPAWSTFLARQMIKNDVFKKKFINCMADYLNTRFKTEEVLEKITYFQELLDPEMEEYIVRYQRESMHSKDYWENITIPIMTKFADKRDHNLKILTNNYFKLGGYYNLELTSSVPEGGYIRINDNIDVLYDEGESLFTGAYYNGVPITLEAIARKGYHFVGWTGVDSTNAQIDLDMATDLHLEALFELN